MSRLVEPIRLKNVMVYLAQTFPFFYLCLRVLFFALIASPALAQAEGSNETAALIELKTQTIVDEQAVGQSLVSPALEGPETSIENKSSEEKMSTVSSTVTAQEAICNHYWLVSARRCVQTIHNKSRGPWHLDVSYAHSSGASNISNVNQLSAQLIPGVPVCIFTHGSFVTMKSHSHQACRAFRRIRWASGTAPLQMIFFTWPSDGPYTHIPQVDVSVRGKRAEFNGFHLATLISSIPESCPVTLVGHSHGARVSLAAMHLGAGGSVQGHSYTRSLGQRRLRLVIAAGALDHDWLNPGKRYGLALNRVECFLNLINQNDLPLAFYPLHRPFARRAIARSGLTSRDTATLGWNAAKVRQVDVTNRLGNAHNWPNYYDDSQVLATIVPYLVWY